MDVERTWNLIVVCAAQELDRNIEAYDELVVCSENSLESGPVNREIERVLNREDKEGKGILHPLISVLIRVNPIGSLLFRPSSFVIRHWEIGSFVFRPSSFVVLHWELAHCSSVFHPSSFVIG